jgi:hypothetical protein
MQTPRTRATGNPVASEPVFIYIAIDAAEKRALPGFQLEGLPGTLALGEGQIAPIRE